MPHDPFSAIVAPRPVAWISSRGAEGAVNLAPYSFFTAVAYTPPQIIVSSVGGKTDRPVGKDTSSNITETGVFCVNIVGRDRVEQVNETSAEWPRQVNEAERLGIDLVECKMIACPRVADAAASLECRLIQTIQLEGKENHLMIGRVEAVHLRDDLITEEGRFDVTRFAPLVRLGYRDFGSASEVFSLQRPRRPESE